MEIPSYVDSIFPPDSLVLKVSNNFLPTVYGIDGQGRLCRLNTSYDRMSYANVYQVTCRLIDWLGEQSARAQGLRCAITSAELMRNRDEYTVYMLVQPSPKGRCRRQVVGMIKLGRKHLYMSDRSGHTVRCGPLCLLDFFVHESFQRSGLGRQLFESAFAVEGYMADEYHKVAIDRPSRKLMNFMAKHYGLAETVAQSNNYVVYDKFFDTVPLQDCMGNALKSRVVGPPSETPTGAEWTANKRRIHMGRIVSN